MTGRAPCAEDGFSFFFLGGSSCTPPISSEDCCAPWLSFEDCCAPWLSLWGSLLGLFPLTISFFGTRLASWLLPFDGTRDPELSVSKRTVQGEKAQGLRTHEKRDSNTKVREKKARGRKDLHRLFFSFSQIFIIILIG